MQPKKIKLNIRLIYHRFTFIDLFAGTGAFTHALNSNNLKCVYANDVVSFTANL